MSKTERTDRFIAIKSMFEQGNVQRMKDLDKIFPTAMAVAMGMNYDRYILCLYSPTDFKAREIMLFASLVNIDSRKIWDVIIKETSPTKITRKKAVRKKSAPKKSA